MALEVQDVKHKPHSPELGDDTVPKQLPFGLDDVLTRTACSLARIDPGRCLCDDFGRAGFDRRRSRSQKLNRAKNDPNLFCSQLPGPATIRSLGAQ